jgi:hypothetical protein
LRIVHKGCKDSHGGSGGDERWGDERCMCVCIHTHAHTHTWTWTWTYTIQIPMHKNFQILIQIHVYLHRQICVILSHMNVPTLPNDNQNRNE